MRRRIDAIHVRPTPDCGKWKSTSSPTFGIVDKTSARQRRSGCCSAALKILRSSDSTLHPCVAAPCLSAAAIPSHISNNQICCYHPPSIIMMLRRLPRQNRCIGKDSVTLRVDCFDTEVTPMSTSKKQLQNVLLLIGKRPNVPVCSVRRTRTDPLPRRRVLFKMAA